MQELDEKQLEQVELTPADHNVSEQIPHIQPEKFGSQAHEAPVDTSISSVQSVAVPVFVIFGYLAVSYLYFGFGEVDGFGGGDITTGESIVTSVYFAMATITTVGYGDFGAGQKPGDQLFTTMFAFMGVSIVGMCIGELVDFIVTKMASREKAKMQKFLADTKKAVQSAQMSTQTGKVATKIGENIKEITGAAKIFKILSPMVFVLLVGACILMTTEEEDEIAKADNFFMASIYSSMITGLSVGYGDFFPHSHTGRALYIIFIPLSVVVLMSSITNCNEAFKELRTKKKVKYMEIKEIMLMDADGDGSISKEEYCLFMLKALGKVDPAVVDGLGKQFQALDADGSGFLDLTDFPPGVQLKKTIHTFKGRERMDVEVLTEAEANAADAKAAAQSDTDVTQSASDDGKTEVLQPPLQISEVAETKCKIQV